MPTKKTRDLSDFKARFDKKAQIRMRLQATVAALRTLGPEEWRSEREIANTAKVSCKDIPSIRDEFKEHIVTVPSLNRGKTMSVWFADPKVAAKVRAAQ
jgi:hypothetical protein